MFIKKLVTDFKDIINLKTGLLKETKLRSLLFTYKEEEKFQLAVLLKICEYIKFPKFPNIVLGNDTELDEEYIGVLAEIYKSSNSYRDYNNTIKKLPTYFQQFLHIFMSRTIFLHITKKQATDLLPHFSRIKKEDIVKLIDLQIEKNTSQLTQNVTNRFIITPSISFPTSIILPRLEYKRKSIKCDIFYFGRRGRIRNKIGVVSKEIENMFNLYSFSIIGARYQIKNKTFYSLLGFSYNFYTYSNLQEVLKFIPLREIKLGSYKHLIPNYNSIKEYYVQSKIMSVSETTNLPTNFSNFLVYSKNKIYNYYVKAKTYTCEVKSLLFNEHKGLYDKVVVSYNNKDQITLELNLPSLLKEANKADIVDLLNRKNQKLFVNVRLIFNNTRVMGYEFRSFKFFTLHLCKMCGKVLTHPHARLCVNCYFGVKHIIDGEKFDFVFPTFGYYKDTEFRMFGYRFRDINGEGFKIDNEKLKGQQLSLPLFDNDSKLTNSIKHFEKVKQDNRLNL